jgi:hypothetical protein
MKRFVPIHPVPLAALVAATLAGCSFAPPVKPPATPAPQRYTAEPAAPV